MRRRDFIDESFWLFPGKPAVSGLREYFHVEFISFLSQPVKPGGQLFVDVSLYPVPEVRVGFLKQRPVGLPADEVVVLIFPAFLRRVPVENINLPAVIRGGIISEPLCLIHRRHEFGLRL